MANYAKIKTKLKMQPNNITKLLNDLNTTIFKNTLTITYTGSDKPYYHEWFIQQNNDITQYRICWLNNSTSFEIKHGGGKNFIWWVDFAICNEIAVKFNGIWTDEADNDKRKGIPHKYDNFQEHTERMFDYMKEWKTESFKKIIYSDVPDKFNPYKLNDVKK
jgi:hypothetical protein